MNPFISGLIRAASESFTWTGPLLEVGSRIVEGQEEYPSPRTFFPGRTYVGVDFQPGTGVDVLASAEALPQQDGSMGAVLALELLEHVRCFWHAVDEFHRVLAPDGLLLITVPFFVRIHNHPGDYWRFTPMALDSLLSRYPNRLIGWYGPQRRPLGVFGLAFGCERKAPSEDELRAFRQRLGQYARWPLSLARRIRYQLGRFLFGSSLFGLELNRDQFDFSLHQTRADDATQQRTNLRSLAA